MKKITFLILMLVSTFCWSQCIVQSQTPSETSTVGNDGSIYTLSTCILAGEYNTILNLTVGNDYEFTNTLSGTNNYITITDPTNVVIAHGMSPLTVNSIAFATIRLHVTVDVSCTTDLSCHITTAQCVSATCVPPMPPVNDICASAEVVPVGIGVCGPDITGTNVDASNSGVPQATCAVATYAGGDIWYQLTVPMDEDTINYNMSASVYSTTQVELFSGSCSALSQFDCTVGATYSFTNLTSGATYYLRIYDWGNDDMGEVTFCLTAPTSTLSVANFESNSIFTYYPNPVKNNLTLNSQNEIVNVKVINMLGQNVMDITPNAVSKDLDMSNLKSGAYFVQVTIGEVVETVRIIKN